MSRLGAAWVMLLVAVALASGPPAWSMAQAIGASSSLAAPYTACGYVQVRWCFGVDRPSEASCRKAKKLLTQYSRLYHKLTRRHLPAKRRIQLDRKREEGRITSHDLPGILQREFPRELEGETLEQIRVLCDRPFTV